MSQVEFSIFVNRITAICMEMGAVLERSALSPNIKDRLDFSCALFDATGGLVAQAAHIPVHLGSMAYAMSDLVEGVDWHLGDVLVVNDPFLGGTHLPDVTLISPCIVEESLMGFVANRAHHADIGADTPGSMPMSTMLNEEGLVIPPTLMLRNGEATAAGRELYAICSPVTAGDLAAQQSAVAIGVQRLSALIASQGLDRYVSGIEQLYTYASTLAVDAYRSIPLGVYEAADLMDDDGNGYRDVPIRVRVTVTRESITVDFGGTSNQVTGNINCPMPVTAAAVLYCFRGLLPDDVPNCYGTFSHIHIAAPEHSLVNAQRPSAVAAGNVETSMRIVDVVLRALQPAMPSRIPAAAQGTMNNVAMGSRSSHDPNARWDYYETIGGGTGAHAHGDGLSGVQAHMTNTLNTPIESLERHYPLRVTAYRIRRYSGGAGRYVGGDGLLRTIRFLEPTEVTLLTERRRHPPWGLGTAQSGQVGRNSLDDRELPGKCHLHVYTGQELTIETPGGGGFGPAAPDEDSG